MLLSTSPGLLLHSLCQPDLAWGGNWVWVAKTTFGGALPQKFKAVIANEEEKLGREVLNIVPNNFDSDQQKC